MGQNWSSCTPTTLNEWYHFDQATLVNVISDVTRKKLGSGHFSKLPQRKSNLENISGSNLHKIIILVTTPMFSWSKNRMKQTSKKIRSFLYCEFEKIQDGCH